MEHVELAAGLSAARGQLRAADGTYDLVVHGWPVPQDE